MSKKAYQLTPPDELEREARQWDADAVIHAGWEDAPEAIPRIKSSTPISLRLPAQMLEILKAFAQREGIGYQVLLKRWLDDRIRQERDALAAETASFSSPRLEGAREQFEQATSFLEDARASKDARYRVRHLVASAHFARAIVELMLEAADEQKISPSRRDLEQNFKVRLPHYSLIEKLGVHDVLPAGILQESNAVDGKLAKSFPAGRGGVAATGPAARSVRETVTESYRVGRQRPAITKDGEVFDEETGEFVSMERVLAEYLAAVPSAVTEFLKSMHE